MGDFNIAPEDRDVHDPQAWHEKILCSTPEREALARVMQPGLADAFRKFHDDGGHYTWWDFRTRGFQRGNRGLRIDHLLVSERLRQAVVDAGVDYDIRGMDKPSDHAPAIAEFDL